MGSIKCPQHSTPLLHPHSTAPPVGKLFTLKIAFKNYHIGHGTYILNRLRGGGAGGSINKSSDRTDAACLRFVLTPIKIFGKQWDGNELNKRVEGRGQVFYRIWQRRAGRAGSMGAEKLRLMSRARFVEQLFNNTSVTLH